MPDSFYALCLSCNSLFSHSDVHMMISLRALNNINFSLFVQVGDICKATSTTTTSWLEAQCEEQGARLLNPQRNGLCSKVA
jgi:hypothetical protein